MGQSSNDSSIFYGERQRAVQQSYHSASSLHCLRLWNHSRADAPTSKLKVGSFGGAGFCVFLLTTLKPRRPSRGWVGGSLENSNLECRQQLLGLFLIVILKLSTTLTIGEGKYMCILWFSLTIWGAEIEPCPIQGWSKADFRINVKFLVRSAIPDIGPFVFIWILCCASSRRSKVCKLQVWEIALWITIDDARL